MNLRLIIPGFLMLAINCHAQTLADSTIIDTSIVFGTWDKSGSPYIIKKNITVPSGETLYIEAGTEIIFAGYHSLSVVGYINCSGSENDSIIFSRNDTTGFYNNSDSLGGWAGIRFWGNGTESAVFKYCIFKNGKAVTNTNPLGGIIAINLSTRTYTFENCTFRDNKAQTGGAIFHFCQSTNQGNLSIRNCNFINNLALYSGGAIYSSGGNQKNTITGSKFKKNVSRFGGAIALHKGITNFRNNFFEGNSATEEGGGIYLNPSTEQSIINCIISDNYAVRGAAICGPSGCYLNIFNSTIVNNTSPGSILYMGNATGTKITNTILWNPGSYEIIRYDASSDLTVTFSDIKDGADSSWFEESCIDSDPLFISSDPDSFFLSPYSPCINAGSIDTSGLLLPPGDFYGNNRIINGRVDMGAVEYQSILITAESKRYSDESLIIFPNPALNDVYFKNDNIENRIYRVILLNSQGMIVATFEKPVNNKLNLQSCQPGIYMLNFCFQEGQMLTRKIIKE